MNIPGFGAQVSLYKSGQVYRGQGRADATAPVVVAALECHDACHLAYVACLVGVIFDPLGDALCFAGLLLCNEQCSPPAGPEGGGGGGPPPPPPVCNGVRCLPGNMCCRCENVEPPMCMSRGLCDRLCRQPGGPAQ
jgi:hypothetical protein